MYEKLRQLIEGEGLLEADRMSVVGVSGGPDSLALLDVLQRLGHRLLVAHLNHKLRPEADDESGQVRRFAQERRLPVCIKEVDVAAFAGSQGLSVEEAARTVRYRFLFEQARQHRAQAVLVGHTADDQVETVLMHFLRGSGLPGLRGMPLRALPNSWSAQIALIRPLLVAWRQEVLGYCAERGLKPSLDESNLDTTYYRNRLRHELIPYLQSYNPAVKQVMQRMSRVLAGDEQVLEEVTQAAWEACIVAQGEGYTAFNAQRLREQPVALQRRLIRGAIATLRPGLRDIDFDSIERAIEFLEQPTRSGERDLAAGLRLVLEEGQLIVATWESELPAGNWPRIPQNASLILPVPGDLALEAGWRMRVQVVEDLESALKDARHNQDPYKAWISLDRLELPLTLRTRQPGDRFTPLGMPDQTVKLSDFMINHKIPRRARHTWPLVAAGDEVVWLPGLRSAHACRLTPSSRRAIYLHLSHAG